MQYLRENNKPNYLAILKHHINNKKLFKNIKRPVILSKENDDDFRIPGINPRGFQPSDEFRPTSYKPADPIKDMNVVVDRHNTIEKYRMKTDAQTASETSRTRDLAIQREISHEKIRKGGQDVRTIIDISDELLKRAIEIGLKPTSQNTKAKDSDSQEIHDIKLKHAEDMGKSTQLDIKRAGDASKMGIEAAGLIAKTTGINAQLEILKLEAESQAELKHYNSTEEINKREAKQGLFRNPVTGKWEYHPDKDLKGQEEITSQDQLNNTTPRQKAIRAIQKERESLKSLEAAGGGPPKPPPANTVYGLSERGRKEQAALQDQREKDQLAQNKKTEAADAVVISMSMKNAVPKVPEPKDTEGMSMEGGEADKADQQKENIKGIIKKTLQNLENEKTEKRRGI